MPRDPDGARRLGRRRWHPLETELLQLLACPACGGGALETDGAGDDADLVCCGCGLRYLQRAGVPLLVSGDGDAHKHSQARYFETGEDPEWEITRPHGAPRLHGWLLAEKFRLSLEGLGPSLAGRTALSVCGGSGMDAELLARAGARVISTDIAPGSAERALERARRFGVPLVAVVADVERLPFLDRSVDLVYVHDGLHHLEDPLRGLAEMARVARRAVSVTEPARAAVTRVATRVGLALSREEAGNPVARLRPEDVEAVLRASGFTVVRSRRYAMLYRHEPGRATRWLSAPVPLALATGALRAANRVAGGLGNKLTVQAVRPPHAGARP